MCEEKACGIKESGSTALKGWPRKMRAVHALSIVCEILFGALSAVYTVGIAQIYL